MSFARRARFPAYSIGQLHISSASKKVVLAKIKNPSDLKISLDQFGRKKQCGDVCILERGIPSSFFDWFARRQTRWFGRLPDGKQPSTGSGFLQGPDVIFLSVNALPESRSRQVPVISEHGGGCLKSWSSIKERGQSSSVMPYSCALCSIEGIG